VLYSSAEGVGKNTSTKTLERCIGENYTNYITDVSNQLFGRFSSAELNKLLIVLNEVKGKDTYANTDLFKTRITDDKREVELKGKDTTQITNYCSYILNTNNTNSVNAGDKDRRFCVLPCVNKKIDDKAYFDHYEKNVNNNPDAIRCIYEYLKTYDIEKVVPNKQFQDARPKSALYTALQECNREKEWDFLEEIVSDHVYDRELVGEHRLFKEIPMNDLWVSYRVFCSKNNYDVSKLPSKRFHFQFSQNIIEIINNKNGFENSVVKDKDRDCRFYKLDMTKLGLYFNLKYEFKPE
jgi:phage/plasmid-associated DNA primase